MKSWQVPVTSVGAVTTASMTWRSSGQLRVSVIVKAAFSFVPHGVLRPAAPVNILDEDMPWNDAPDASVYAPSDRCPYRPRVDFLFSGHAYAPGQVPTQGLNVRVAMARANAKVFDKVVTVVGDRNSAQAPPAVFAKMPIRYERAYGGPGFEANPVGVGYGARGSVAPNIVYPAGWNKDQQPAALGPIAASWPARLSRSANLTANAFDRTVVDLPAQLDPSYFQSAPEDQRITQVFGDEWILLEHLHPTHASLTLKLPDVRGAAMVFGMDGPDTPLALRIDTIFIDGDRELCVLTFRGSHPVPNERALDALRIAAGIELGGVPMDWTEAKRVTSSASAAPGTTALDSNAPITFVTPFALAEPGTSSKASSASIPGAPFSAAMTPGPNAQIPVGYATFAFAPPTPPQPPVSVPPNPQSPRAIPMSAVPTTPPLPVEEKPSWSWATPAPEAAPTLPQPVVPAKPPAVRPASPAAPAAKSALYGGFTPLKKS